MNRGHRELFSGSEVPAFLAWRELIFPVVLRWGNPLTLPSRPRPPSSEWARVGMRVVIWWETAVLPNRSPGAVLCPEPVPTAWQWQWWWHIDWSRDSRHDPNSEDPGNRGLQGCSLPPWETQDSISDRKEPPHLVRPFCDSVTSWQSSYFRTTLSGSLVPHSLIHSFIHLPYYMPGTVLGPWVYSSEQGR